MMIAEMILYIIRAMHIDKILLEKKDYPCNPPPPNQFKPPFVHEMDEDAGDENGGPKDKIKTS